MEVDWSSMQDGLAGEAITLPQRHAPGTMQLDSFTETNITSRPPPALAFEDQAPEPLPDLERDEEDRMAPDEWPDLDEYIHADFDDAQVSPKASPQATAQEVIVILTDQEGLSDEPLMMHWRFLRAGEALDGSSGSVFLPKSAGGGTTNTYSGQVDLRPQATTLLEQEDRLEVWFSASDRSGRIIT
ncbi:hypothetical protein N9K81_04215, partial [Candidatus Poseidoniales archaeon]|nr:hypothetical protein [Candidatus Poseidoniales archaeon]